MENECCSHDYESHCACCNGECTNCNEQETKEFIVKVTSTWLVDAVDAEEAINIFSDGNMLDLQEVAELNEKKVQA